MPERTVGNFSDLRRIFPAGSVRGLAPASEGFIGGPTCQRRGLGGEIHSRNPFSRGRRSGT